MLRAGVGSMITGLADDAVGRVVPARDRPVPAQRQSAILFVVVLGAAPSIANGIIDGIDNVPPILLRAGRVLGARGLTVAAPRRDPGRAAVGRRRAEAGLGVRVAQPDGRRADRRCIPGHLGIGADASTARAQNADYVGVYEAMIVIFIIGVVVDALFFGTADRAIRRRYGLIDARRLS